MRRVIAVAVFVAAVAVLIGGLLPRAVGLYLEHCHSALLDAVAARGYRLTARDYRLGWGCSEAEVEIAPPATGDDATSRLRIALALRHDYDVWLHGLPPRLAAISGRASLLGGPRPLPPLVLAATLGLAGDVEGTVRVPDVTYSGAVGRLHFLSGLSEFELTPQGRWTLSGQLAALEAEDAGRRKLRLKGLGWSLSQGDAATTLPVGALSLTLERLSLDRCRPHWLRSWTRRHRPRRRRCCGRVGALPSKAGSSRGCDSTKAP